MKKVFKTVVAVITVISAVLSLSSCSLFKTMRENAEKAAMIEIADTPQNDQILDSFNSLTAVSVKKASQIKENVSYSAGTPEITKDGEKAGTLADSAKQLKKLIMAGKPGNTSRILENGTEDSLIKEISEVSVFNTVCDRNISYENVTDEKGREQSDENGNAITEEYISDNIAHFRIEYYDIKNSDGSDYEETPDKHAADEEETTVIFADSEEIKSVFGNDADKASVIEDFDCFSDFIKVKDYNIEYNKCYITSDADLNGQTVSFIKFTKDMTVTASAEGVGDLSGYGDIQVTIKLTKTVNYEFSYPEEADNSAG